MPGSLIEWFGGIIPVFSAEMAVTSLNVEPGAYWPWSARLFSG